MSCALFTVLGVSLWARCNIVIHWPREYRHACSAYTWCCIQSTTTTITSLQPQHHLPGTKRGKLFRVFRRLGVLDTWTEAVVGKVYNTDTVCIHHLMEMRGMGALTLAWTDNVWPPPAPSWWAQVWPRIAQSRCHKPRHKPRHEPRHTPRHKPPSLSDGLASQINCGWNQCLPVTFIFYLNPKNIITCPNWPGQRIWSIHLRGNVHLDKILVA